MGIEGATDWRSELVSALEWWRDAGLDVLVEDDPRDWTARVENTPKTAQISHSTAVEAPVEVALPATIEAFTDWRYGVGAPEAVLGESLFLPEGEVSAQLMVITDIPECESGEENLLGGPAGRIFDKMLAAIGHSRESIYLVPLCAARTITGQPPRAMYGRLAELLRHQVTLVAPKKILLLGQSVSRAILAPDATRNADGLISFQYPNGQSLAVPSFHPRLYLKKPAAKADGWRDLQLLLKGQSQ